MSEHNDISAGSEHASWDDIDYQRARDCMIGVLRGNAWTIRDGKMSNEFDNAFQHAVGILSLTARITGDAQDAVVRDGVIEQIAHRLAECYPENANTNAFCAAIRSMKLEAPSPPQCSAASRDDIRCTLAQLYVLMDTMEALRGDKDVLRISGQRGDAQDVGIAGIKGTLETIENAARILASLTVGEPQTAASEPAAYQMTGDNGEWLDPMPARDGARVRHRYAVGIADGSTKLRALYAAEPQTSGVWQPIETAPKDGTVFLFFAADCGLPGPGECMWSGSRWHAFGGMGGMTCHPTHWQPLPAPPLPRPHGGGK